VHFIDGLQMIHHGAFETAFLLMRDLLPTNQPCRAASVWYLLQIDKSKKSLAAGTGQ
jgi:hypothetical protein